MKLVVLLLDRLLELRSDKEIMATHASVQKYLTDWSLETVNERPIVTMWRVPTGEKNAFNEDITKVGGLAFEFDDPRAAMMFKLRWL